MLVLERGGDGESETIAGRHLTAHATDTDNTFSLFSISYLEARSIFGVTKTNVVVVAAIAIMIAILVTDTDKESTGKVIVCQAHNPVATTFVIYGSSIFAVATHPFT